MEHGNKKLLINIAAVVVVVLTLLITIALYIDQNSKKQATIGHSGGPLLGALYVATQETQWKKTFSLVKQGTSADIGYALLSGDIDAGFVEPSKIPALKNLPGFEKLATVGKITFPYGATLVVRADLNLRINDLVGHTIGISSYECKLLEAFKEDAIRLGVDVSALKFKQLPFDTMIPALEASIIDAAIIKGSYGVIAQKQGHKILYQNWEVIPGDECCPAIVDQLELVLLARTDRAEATLLLPQRLLEAQNRDVNILRTAISQGTSIPLSILEGLPVAKFELADNELIEILVEHDHDEDEHDENK